MSKTTAILDRTMSQVLREIETAHVVLSGIERAIASLAEETSEDPGAQRRLSAISVMTIVISEQIEKASLNISEALQLAHAGRAKS